MNKREAPQDLQEFNEAAGKILATTLKSNAGKLQLIVRDKEDKPIALIVCIVEDVQEYLDALDQCAERMESSEEKES